MSAPSGKSPTGGHGEIGATDPEGLAAVHVMVTGCSPSSTASALELGMPYYLGVRHALGAVRGRDLIAWDVDADVWVRHPTTPPAARASSPRLLGDEFELLTAETHDDYEYLFPRLALSGIHHVLRARRRLPARPGAAHRRGRAGVYPQA